MSSCGAPVRELAHSLLLRHLQQTPAAADRCVSAYFECQDSGDECAHAMLLDRLPDIVMLAQGELARAPNAGPVWSEPCAPERRESADRCSPSQRSSR